LACARRLPLRLRRQAARPRPNPAARARARIGADSRRRPPRQYNLPSGVASHLDDEFVAVDGSGVRPPEPRGRQAAPASGAYRRMAGRSAAVDVSLDLTAPA